MPGAQFRECRFVRCRFTHVDLREAAFVRCNFADADSHSGVEIAFSQLDQARFEACDLSFADIDRTSLWSVEFVETNLRGARFHRADFARALSPKTIHTAATFKRCNLELADLSDAALKGCDRLDVGADLAGALRQGRGITLPALEASNPGRVRIYAPGGGFLGLGELAAGGQLRPLRLISAHANPA